MTQDAKVEIINDVREHLVGGADAHPTRCSSCGSHGGNDNVCVYAAEMGGDRRCNCCVDCARECAMEI